MAETGIRLARTSKLPDFNLGIEADARSSPVMWRPSLGVTLPIWRDKIAAEIGSAQALKSAAQARLSAEQIQLAVEFADKSFMYREATRNLQLLTDSLLPKARQALEVARSGYSSGKVDFINLLDAERSLLEFQQAEVEARTRRELVLAEVSLLIIGRPAAGRADPDRDWRVAAHGPSILKNKMSPLPFNSLNSSMNKRIALLLVAVLAAAIGLSSVSCRRPAGGPGAHDARRAAQRSLPDAPDACCDKPGDCPICNMKLVPIKADEPAAPAAGPSTAPAPDDKDRPGQSRPVLLPHGGRTHPGQTRQMPHL